MKWLFVEFHYYMTKLYSKLFDYHAKKFHEIADIIRGNEDAE